MSFLVLSVRLNLTAQSMDGFLKFSMLPLNLVKELNENPAGKYLVDMLGIKRDVDIKA
ncbi:hypothetical protein UNSW3_1308 [Campylobacter concisus UNSW3]|uniref:Uncharacterized protein n=1 Tax=Campylobacter concisus UNSW3 TaxID=1242966 RepID=U2FZ00_9BACT|nr:hypothetical protein [Campylobacter concisus]ERJ21004.1 hypothetical protein UNSW3_1308 [Campylobacter concisus UNSW3]